MGAYHTTGLPHMWEPKLISLRDKLYIFVGIPNNLVDKIDYDLEPFAEVYDHELDYWSVLTPPPQVPLLNCCFNSLLIISLGEFEGKIMVYSPVDKDSLMYIYDIDTEVWKTYPCSVLDHLLVANNRISGFEVSIEHDHMLYWLDKRTAFIHAFNWRTYQLYSGPIIGLECEHGFNNMIHETDDVSLHHLSGDLFYIFWSTSDWVQKVNVKTELHLTVLRVVKYTSICALDAFVVGCLQDTVSGSYCSFDAVQI
ncbi:hypothetical protein KSS87_017450 [Heliosperma pusillum]|nr:hypothetical protein KSS87_017450 [Heliosperma pusillum]